ncbi:MAG: tRNA lysidine(34) synthetase TilS [Pseudomonadota bacterium]
MRFGRGLTALIDRFQSDPNSPIAIAVSGGSDSLALLHAAKAWADDTDRRIIAFTVDHRLRPEAALEAQFVAEVCQSLGVEHQTLAWINPRATQNAARRARYRLIGVAMRAVGARCLLTGHTQDDVVETMMIRRRHGVRDAMAIGPAVAAPLPVWPEGYGITVLRPLLESRRSSLQSYLNELGSTWVEDPSNADAKFERVRVRQFFARHPRLAEIARQTSRSLRIERQRMDSDFASQLGKVRVSADGLIDTDAADVSIRLMTLLTRVASGSDRDPRAGAVADVLVNVQDPGQRQTIGGAWLQRARSGMLIGVDPAAAADTREADIFDGRYVKDDTARLPSADDMSFLVRHARPSGDAWRSIIPDRISQIQKCLQTSVS